MMLPAQHPQPRPRTRSDWFLSWRWRVSLPLFIVLAPLLMCGTYALVTLLTSEVVAGQSQQFTRQVDALTAQLNATYAEHLQDVQRVAFTVDVPLAVQMRQTEFLHDLLEPFARASGIDALFVTDADGVELLGLRYVPQANDYAANQGTRFDQLVPVQQALQNQSAHSAILQTPEGASLVMGGAVLNDGSVVGTVMIGRQLNDLANALERTQTLRLALYSTTGSLITATLDGVPNTLEGTPTAQTQAITLNDQAYWSAVLPFQYGSDTLGWMAVYLPNVAQTTLGASQQLISIVASATMGITLVLVFVGVSRFSQRVERVQRTAQALQHGHASARTHLRPNDEAGAVGVALDRYADQVQHEQRMLQQLLQQQRQDLLQIYAVLASITDGVLVHNLHGQITFMNESARQLLLAHPHESPTRLLANVAHAVERDAGVAVAPGIYTLGHSQQVAWGQRVLTVQVAMLTNELGQRMGTVILLRDSSAEHQHQRENDRLRAEIAQMRMSPVPQQDDLQPSVPLFTQALAGKTSTLQRLIVTMRELQVDDIHELERHLKPILLDAFVWTLANDWRQIAQTAQLQLHVLVAVQGLVTLGDEKRLRWAFGNLLDNAIRYTPPHGALTIEITDADAGQATLRVRDNGVGIATHELKHVGEQFFRGTPTRADGKRLAHHGMGQGVFSAKQIITAHGGTLQVKSKHGVGTAVYVRLPLTTLAHGTHDLRQLAMFEGETLPMGADVLPNL